MSPTYLKMHHGAARYQRPIPKALQRFFAGVKVVSEHIGRFAEGRAGDTAAQAEALRRKLRDDEHFAELTRMAAAGALEGVQDVRKLKSRIAALEQNLAALEPTGVLLAKARAAPSDVGRQVYTAIATMREEGVAELESAKAIPLVAQPTVEHSIDGLFRLWMTTTAPKETRHHARAAKLLGKYLGNVDFRSVQQEDLHDFPQWMVVDQKVKTISANKNLDYVKGLFGAAMPKYRKDNPAHGVRKLDEGDKAQKKPFTGSQLRTLFERVAADKWGGKRHTEIQWILKICLYTGCRPNEAAQIQRGDVYTDQGIQLIHFRQVDAVTGVKHLQKRIKTSKKRKNAGARQFPLPAELGEFYAWATDGPADEFVFKALTYSRSNKRATWLITNMRALLDSLGMKDHLLTLYSLRHTFVRARRNAGISREVGEILDGHKNGIEAGYGDGVDLHVLKAAVDRIKPFAIAG